MKRLLELRVTSLPVDSHRGAVCEKLKSRECEKLSDAFEVAVPYATTRQDLRACARVAVLALHEVPRRARGGRAHPQPAGGTRVDQTGPALGPLNTVKKLYLFTQHFVIEQEQRGEGDYNRQTKQWPNY
jgi:hypothetical protein